MKTSTVFITGAVLLVGLLGCAEVASADDNVATPTSASSSWLAPQAQYVPVLPAPKTAVQPAPHSVNAPADIYQP